MKLNRAAATKTEQFVMRFSEADRARLVALATEHEVTGAELVRSLLRKEYVRLFGKDADPMAKRPKGGA